MKRNVFAILVLMLTLTLAIPAVTFVPAEAATKKAVKLNKKKATLTVGKTLQLKVKNNKKKVTWKSSNKKVASVSGKGLVKAKYPGKATITAKVGKKKLKCTIKVYDVNRTLTCHDKKPLEQILTYQVKDGVYVDVTIKINSVEIKSKTSDTSIGGYNGTYRYDAAFTGTSSMGDPYTLDGGKKVPVQLSEADKAAVTKTVIDKSKNTSICVHYENKISESKADNIDKHYAMKTVASTDKGYNGIVSNFIFDYVKGEFTLKVTDLTIRDSYRYFVYHAENADACD